MWQAWRRVASSASIVACVALGPIVVLGVIVQPLVTLIAGPERQDWLFRAFFGWAWLLFPYGPVRPRMPTEVAALLAALQWSAVIAGVHVMGRGATLRVRLLWAVCCVVAAGALMLAGLHLAGYTFGFARPLG